MHKIPNLPNLPILPDAPPPPGEHLPNQSESGLFFSYIALSVFRPITYIDLSSLITLTNQIVVSNITSSLVSHYYNNTMDLQTNLTHIGFTEYEAKVYLALLKVYPATGYQISKNSGVPRSMVYEVLSRLHQRGAVLETIETRATYYRPLPPEVLLDQHQKEHRQLLGSLRPGLQALYQETETERAWSITGRSAILTYSIQLLESAQQEVFMVLNDRDLADLQPALLALDSRQVSLGVLLTGQAELQSGSVMRHPPLESELQGLTDTLLLIADGREALVADTADQARATITTNANLVLIARQFVWMEFLTQRIYARLGQDLLDRLDPADRKIFESLTK